MKYSRKLSEYFLPTLKEDPKEAENFLDLPVVCAIPRLYTQKELRQKRIFRSAWYTGLCIAYAGVMAAGVYFWNQGLIVL